MPVLTMGVFLFGGLLTGLVAGLAISAVLGGLAGFLVARLHDRRKHVIATFSVALAIILGAAIYAIRSLPLEWGNPGSNYDLIMSNLFCLALWYSASLGAAAGMAAILTLLVPTAPRIATPANTLNLAEPPPLPIINTQ